MAVGFAVDLRRGFRMNEQGKAEAYQPANAENQGAVQEAIDSCPVSAIAWED